MRARHLTQAVAQRRQSDTKERDADKAARLVARLFPAQRDFVEDPSNRKAALCPRQCGKSFSVLVYALYTCLKRPGARVLILARVRRQAKGIYWQDAKQFAIEFELGGKFHGTDLEYTLHNGSVIQFAGADTAEEVDKYRGQRFDLIIIDEGKSYSADLMGEMIGQVLEPALLARRGTLAIIGTPGSILAGPFWEITTCQKNANGDFLARPYAKRKDPDWVGVRSYWSLHGWTQEDNIYCPHIWEQSLALKDAHGYADDDPAWLREYRGKWVPDESMLVYAWDRVVDDRCVFVPSDDPAARFGLPPEHEWRFILGMDIGFHDDTSFVVGAWAETYKALVYLHAEKHPYLTVEGIAERVQSLETQFGGFDVRVADTGGLGKTIVESLSSTYGVHFEAARKTEKHDHIKLLNSDLLVGRIQVPEHSVLIEEWKTAQWDDSSKKHIDPNCDDHASDGALYIWRYAYHHWHRALEAQETPGSTQWWAKAQRDSELKYEQELLDAKRSPFRSRYADLAKHDNPLRTAWTLRRLKSTLS